MKNDVYDMMDRVYTICDDYLYETEKKIKSIISNFEEILNVSSSFKSKKKNLIDKSSIDYNEQKRKQLYSKFQKVIETSNGILSVQKDHLGMVLLNVFQNYDEVVEIKKLQNYVIWNKEIVERIKCSAGESIEHMKFLEINYKDRLNDYWVNKTNKEIKELTEFMANFYDNEYQEILEIEEKSKNIIPSSKR